jgi:hypothetical protein
MAIYIEIKKVAESPDSAEYSFGLGAGPEGRLILRKATGEVELLSAHPDDSESKGFFSRAAHKVRSHWKKGELPELTCWAS